MSRDAILHRVRTALGHTAEGRPPEPPPLYLRVPELPLEQRILLFIEALESLAGKAHRAPDRAAVPGILGGILNGRSALMAADPFLAGCEVATVPGVFGPLPDASAIRSAAETVDAGITSAHYALAETGTLAILAGPEQSRLLSLLPPVHIAIVPVSRLLANLEELLSVMPDPAALSSALVLITGPSRTADIEQILIRGVHGPGEVHVILVESETEG